MEFDGTMQLPMPLEDAWEKLIDVRFLVQCLPDLDKIESSDEGRAVCTVRPGFSFVRGKLQTTIERGELATQQSAMFRMFSKGVGSSSEVESTLTFHADGDGTRVDWRAAVVKLGGLLKAAPKGLLRGAAQQTIANTWENVAERIQTEADAAS